MYIRKATHEDLSKIMSIYKISQDIMIESGNPNQWGRTNPKKEKIIEDIDNEISYLICDDENIYGVFAIFEGEEPTYKHIENGKWINEDKYITIHRIASDGTQKGIFKCLIDYCKSKFENIRIDTHHDNKIMQKLIERNGFKKCGKIYVADGSPRIAYHWINPSL